ncbi:MAG: hypothetical protein LBG60_08095 [Bifidobacteriaceae bacterium]|jgi:hypothetical protein|nr:hypothetical protein [Bifidobacteriaceae bacterium]
MAFEYRKLTPEEKDWFRSYNLDSPCWTGKADTPIYAAVDDERGAMFTGLCTAPTGEGRPMFWALLWDGHVIVFESSYRGEGNIVIGRRYWVNVDRADPADSPLWKRPDILPAIRQGFAARLATRRPETLLSVEFSGKFGKRLERVSQS